MHKVKDLTIFQIYKVPSQDKKLHRNIFNALRWIKVIIKIIKNKIINLNCQINYFKMI